MHFLHVVRRKAASLGSGEAPMNALSMLAVCATAAALALLAGEAVGADGLFCDARTLLVIPTQAHFRSGRRAKHVTNICLVPQLCSGGLVT